MLCQRWIAVLACALLTAGCNQSTETPPTGTAGPAAHPDAASAVANNTDPTIVAQTNDPASAVHQWLDAVRTGDDVKATAMLTIQAQQKAAEQNRSVRPPASDTARFQVGAVEYVGEDGARVASSWTDLDESGAPQTDEALWVLRKEAAGWRIAGVAATIFEGEPPLLLNFEDPDEMARKQQWAREEIQRRFEAEYQAKDPQSGEPAIRR